VTIAGYEAGARAVVVVRLGEAEFGVPVTRVREVVRAPAATPVPFTTPAVRGIASVRGEIVPVLDLAARVLGAPAPGAARLVVVSDAAGAPVGLLVDRVVGLADPLDATRQAPPEAEAAAPAGLITGVLAPADAPAITLLDLDAVLTPESTPNEEAR
jgi:chemotaxis signal transduction protein